MAIQKILVAYNFTGLDQKAMDFVVNAFGRHAGIEITIFHAYTPLPEIETEATLVTGKLKGSLSYLSQQIMQRENELKAVVAKLRQDALSETQINTVFKPRKKDIAGELIDLTRDTKFDVMVLSRKSARVTRFFSGSVSSKVLMTIKDMTVCIVS